MTKHATDQNPFYDMASHFQHKIYQSFKGKIRKKIILNDLSKHLDSKADILDVGAGSGEIAAELAALGHRLTLVEPVNELLTSAQKKIADMNVSEADVDFYHSTYQQFFTHALTKNKKFDVICVHAVLEWLEKPFNLLDHLPSLLKKHGKLSLAFYNKDALILHNLIRGNLYATTKTLRGQKSGLTPINPFHYHEILSKLAEKHFRIIDQSGIRVFHDYMQKGTRDRISEQDLMDYEMHNSKNPSLINVARYIHLIAEY